MTNLVPTSCARVPWIVVTMAAVVTMAVVVTMAAVAAAESLTVPPAVLEAEAARVAAMDRVKGSVLAVFSPSGGGGGSGVVISPDGFALTNYHVVKPCGNAMKCGMADGKLYDAVIVGIDPAGDVALIKLFGRGDFPTAQLADSDLIRVGDECFAMGNPFVLATDFQPTVTWGIVSGTRRYQHPAGTLLEYADCIQTDASINPGNSGGPLFNAQGQLIGINGRASFEKRGRVNVGAAYAISINQIKLFLGQLHSGRIVDHATLGATVGSDYDGNVVVDHILDDSDAYRRGLRYRSRILSFGGRDIATPNQFKNVLGIYPKGWRVPLVFHQDGQRHEVLVRLRGLHDEEDLIRKVTGPERPVPMLPDEPDANEPDADESQPGEAKPAEAENAPRLDPRGTEPGDDPDAPDGQPGDSPGVPRRIQVPLRRGRSMPRAAQPEEPMPKIAQEHFESKRGFANYYFNRIHQERILTAWNTRSNWPTASGPWTLAGKLGNGGQFELVVADNACRLQLPTNPLDWTAPEQWDEDPAPTDSGGFFPAMLMWRQLALNGAAGFESLVYLGVSPLPGHEAWLDVLVARARGVEAWFYFGLEDSRLLAIELFANGDDADPCEVRLLNYREYDGCHVPGRIEVYHGEAPFASFQMDAWRFDSAAPALEEGTP